MAVKRKAHKPIKKAVRATSKSNKNRNIALLLAVLIIVLLAIVLITPDSDVSSSSCQSICKDAGYSGAVSNSCIALTSCNDPNYPLVGQANICGDAGEGFNDQVCCCNVGL